jgi:hypothetical protein
VAKAADFVDGGGQDDWLGYPQESLKRFYFFEKGNIGGLIGSSSDFHGVSPVAAVCVSNDDIAGTIAAPAPSVAAQYI